MQDAESFKIFSKSLVKQAEFLGTERLLEKRARHEFDKEKDGIFALQFSSDGTAVAIGYGDGTIQVCILWLITYVAEENILQ